MVGSNMYGGIPCLGAILHDLYCTYARLQWQSQGRMELWIPPVISIIVHMMILLGTESVVQLAQDALKFTAFDVQSRKLYGQCRKTPCWVENRACLLRHAPKPSCETLACLCSFVIVSTSSAWWFFVDWWVCGSAVAQKPCMYYISIFHSSHLTLLACFHHIR